MVLIFVFVAFDSIVTDLLIGPIRFVSYFTLITVEPPGKMGSPVHSGTVQPHEPLQRFKIRGESPVLVTRNSQPPGAPCYKVP